MGIWIMEKKMETTKVYWRYIGNNGEENGNYFFSYFTETLREVELQRISDALKAQPCAARIGMGPPRNLQYSYVVVSQNRGPQYRPQNTIILFTGTPKMVPLFLGIPMYSCWIHRLTERRPGDRGGLEDPDQQWQGT